MVKEAARRRQPRGGSQEEAARRHPESSGGAQEAPRRHQQAPGGSQEAPRPVSVSVSASVPKLLLLLIFKSLWRLPTAGLRLQDPR